VKPKRPSQSATDNTVCADWVKVVVNLLDITGQDFGEDSTHWQQWWEGQG